MTRDALAKAALRLSAKDRADLIDEILVSLADGADPAVQALWATEAKRRRDEVRAGEVEPIPGEQVLAEIQQLLRR